MKKLRNLATSSSTANPFGLLSSPSNLNKPFYFGENPEAPPRRLTDGRKRSPLRWRVPLPEYLEVQLACPKGKRKRWTYLL
jgi:hypothetical protein